MRWKCSSRSSQKIQLRRNLQPCSDSLPGKKNMSFCCYFLYKFTVLTSQISEFHSWSYLLSANSKQNAISQCNLPVVRNPLIMLIKLRLFSRSEVSEIQIMQWSCLRTSISKPSTRAEPIASLQRMWIWLFTVSAVLKYSILVYTSQVNSGFRAISLVLLSRNILHNSPPLKTTWRPVLFKLRKKNLF